LSLILAATGRLEEAIGEARNGHPVLDPYGPAFLLYLAGRCGESTPLLQTGASGSPMAHLIAGSCLVARGEAAAGVVELQKARAIAGENGPIFGIPGRLGHAYAAAGDGSSALQVLAHLQSAPEVERRYVQMALIHAGLGDSEGALECLERAVERREAEVLFAAVEPMLAAIRREPRFRSVLRNLGTNPEDGIDRDTAPMPWTP
jgi:hypothetical protein